MSTMNEQQDQIVEEFSIFDEWLDKYGYLIELGNTLPPMEATYKTPQNIIEGCQSRVWIHAQYENGKIILQGESDAVIVKGIVALLLRVLSDRTPQEIIDADLYFIKKIGLNEHLSPTRSNGLASMIKQIKLYAIAYKAQQSN